MRTVLTGLMILLLCIGAVAGDVTIAWDASISPGVTGHKVYKGTAAGVYDAPTIIGNQTTYTFTGLGAGTYFFAVKCFDGAGNESDFATAQADPTKKYVSTTLYGPLNLSGPASSNGTAGAPYSGSLAATGGKSPYTYSITSGALPAGLTLNPSTGSITGTPTTAGTFNVTFRVTDSQSPGATAGVTVAFQIILAPPGGIKITSQTAQINWYGVVLLATSNQKGTSILRYQKIEPGAGWSTIIASQKPKTEHRAVIYMAQGTPPAYYRYEWKITDESGNTATGGSTFQTR